MTVVYQGEKSIFLGARAYLIDDLNHETAWAENFVEKNPAYSYVVGKFVEADRANDNRQYFDLEGLKIAKASITYSPLNLLHSPRIIGTYVASEFMYPTESADAGEAHPYIDALGVLWKWHFPEEVRLIEKAHAENQLFFSMECISKSITCAGDQGCGREFAYAGARSNTYCQHLNAGPGIKQLNDPHFVAGAILIPPIKPGWKGASVHEVSELVKEYAMETEKAGVEEPVEEPVAPEAEEPTVDVAEEARAAAWTEMMNDLLEQAAVLSPKARKSLPDSDFALPGRRYPIHDINHARNALARVAQNGTPAEQAIVKKKVYARYPGLKK